MLRRSTSFARKKISEMFGPILVLLPRAPSKKHADSRRIREKSFFSEFQNAVSRRSEGVVGPDFGRKTILKYILVFFELLNATSGIHGCAASSIEDQLTPAIDTGIAL